MVREEGMFYICCFWSAVGFRYYTTLCILSALLETWNRVGTKYRNVSRFSAATPEIATRWRSFSLLRSLAQ